MIPVHSLSGIYPVTSLKDYKSRIQTSPHKPSCKDGTGEETTLKKKLSKDLENTRQLIKLCKHLQNTSEVPKYSDKHRKKKTVHRHRKKRKHHSKPSSSSSSEPSEYSSSDSSS
uniref:ORF3 n=1 Tax=Chimpanzee anellovirus TaxID=1743410 RepID=A0A0S2GMG8_9VIRU|nr:ORF3 [Chimpanzee anellovirus]